MNKVAVFLLGILFVGALMLCSVSQQTSVIMEASAVELVERPRSYSSGYMPRMIMEMNSIGCKTDEEYKALIDEWRSVNEDVVGYIDIPDFEISYPVLQGETNKTYLRTNIYKEADIAGCIFLDSNYPDIYSPVKLIHGHHMANGTMFGKIPDLLKYETLEDAPRIFYTDDLGTKEFEIFSVFSVNSEEESVIVSQYLQMDELDSLKENYISRSWPEAGEMPESSELMMLNTCWYGESGREHYLHCIVVAARV